MLRCVFTKVLLLHRLSFPTLTRHQIKVYPQSPRFVLEREILLYITSFYYDYSSNTSDTSDINSDLYLFTSTYIFLSSNPSHNFLSCPYHITITYPHTSQLPLLALPFFLSYDLVLSTFPCLTIPYYKPHLYIYLPSTI